MTITKLQRTVVDALEDIKAQDIRVFNTTGQSDLFDRVVVASATSNRQTRSLASHVKEKAKENGFEVVSTEGEDTGEWVLVDLGDIVVHIMQPAIRAYYNLEELWGAKPVRVKLGGEPAARAKAAPADSSAEPDTKPRTAARVKPPGAVKAPDARTLTPAKNEAVNPRRRPTAPGSSSRSAITSLRRARTAKTVD